MVAKRPPSRLSRVSPRLFGCRSPSLNSSAPEITPVGSSESEEAPHLSLKKSASITSSYSSWYRITDEIAASAIADEAESRDVAAVGDVFFSKSGKILVGKYAPAADSGLAQSPRADDGIIYFPESTVEDRERGGYGSSTFSSTSASIRHVIAARQMNVERYMEDNASASTNGAGRSLWPTFDGGPYVRASAEEHGPAASTSEEGDGRGKKPGLRKRLKSKVSLWRWREKRMEKAAARSERGSSGEGEAWWKVEG